MSISTLGLDITTEPNSGSNKAIGEIYIQTSNVLSKLNAMKNSEIAAVFDDIAELLKLRKDNIFKIRAYQKAARSINELPVEIAKLVSEDRLDEVPGVGEAINKKITEMVTTGKLDYLEKLKTELPERNTGDKNPK